MEIHPTASTARRGRSWSPRWAPLGGIVGSGLLLANLVVVLAVTPVPKLVPPGYRYWEDFAYATRLWSERQPDPGREWAPGEPHPSLQQAALSEAARLDIRPWQPWKTIPDAALRGTPNAATVRPGEDVGRSLLLAAGFHVLGGVSPFLLLWIAPLACCPCLVWVAVELHRAGWPRASVGFPAAFALSALSVDGLPLAYSAFGFYLLAALVLVALAAHVGSPSADVRSTGLRVVLASIFLTAGAWCRSGVLLLLPGVVFVLASVGRRRGSGMLRSAALTLGLCAPLALPLLLRPRQEHTVWVTLWEGLGDFDRSRGFAWADAAIKRVLLPLGIRDIRSPAAEAEAKRQVLEAIRSDPGWYASILVRRTLATVTQRKLWPWAAVSGRSVAPASHPNEGALDGYYTLAGPADHFRLGPWLVEIPVPVLLLPALAFVGFCAVGWREREPCRRGSGLVVGAALGLGASPVLITTASALETQAFILVHLLAASLLLDVPRGITGRPQERASRPEPPPQPTG